MEKFITLIIVAAALIPLFLRRVNQGEVGLIENLGKFSRETGPGLSFLIPGIQYLRKVDVREREVFIPTLEMYTKN
ncbi:MAG: hypothetical protein QG650_1077 [Patescibacteria group bacterium]|nr:hypothetical protein [Patescibacteria group bacterium]